MNYVLDNNNNKVESYSKEEYLNVLAQAIKDGNLNNITADAAFISGLRCCVSGSTIKEAFITQAKYNELEAQGLIQENTLYNILDDNTYDNLLTIINELKTNQESLLAEIKKVEENKTYIHDITLNYNRMSLSGANEKAKVRFYIFNNKKTIMDFNQVFVWLIHNTTKENSVACYGNFQEHGQSEVINEIYVKNSNMLHLSTINGIEKYLMNEHITIVDVVRG